MVNGDPRLRVCPVSAAAVANTTAAFVCALWRSISDAFPLLCFSWVASMNFTRPLMKRTVAFGLFTTCSWNGNAAVSVIALMSSMTSFPY